MVFRFHIEFDFNQNRPWHTHTSTSLRNSLMPWPRETDEDISRNQQFVNKVLGRVKVKHLHYHVSCECVGRTVEHILFVQIPDYLSTRKKKEWRMCLNYTSTLKMEMSHIHSHTQESGECGMLWICCNSEQKLHRLTHSRLSCYRILIILLDSIECCLNVFEKNISFFVKIRIAWLLREHDTSVMI